MNKENNQEKQVPRIACDCREALMAESMQTQRRVIDWRTQSDDGLRLRCGELTAQEIRLIRAVLNAIISPAALCREADGSVRLDPATCLALKPIHDIGNQAMNERDEWNRWSVGIARTLGVSCSNFASDVVADQYAELRARIKLAIENIANP